MGWRLLIIGVLVASGCEKRSKLYCERNPEDLANCEQTDAPVPPPVMCMTNDDCAGLYCETGANICVECLESAHCATDERCDVGDSYTCRGCIADTDCPGGVCLPAGNCGDDLRVIFVDSAGVDNDECGIASPCASIEHALTFVTETRDIIHVAGNLVESPTIDVDVDIISAPGATLTGLVGPDWVIKINKAIVRVYDLTVICGGGDDQDGFEITGGKTATLDGVDVSGCGRDAAIDVHGGFTTIQRSHIHDNPAGGIRTDGKANYSITNNFIHHNGAELAMSFGGLRLGTDTVREEKIEFNTIVSNAKSGVQCMNPIVAPNNIIAGNGLLGAVNALMCDASGSLVTDQLAPLAFVSTQAPFDYHITETSTAKDNATVPTSVNDDYDRDLRPQGDGRDFGADEYRAP